MKSTRTNDQKKQRPSHLMNNPIKQKEQSESNRGLVFNRPEEEQRSETSNGGSTP